MLLPSSDSAALDRALRAGRPLISAATLTELDEVLHRPKFDKYLSEEERIEFLAALVQEAELVNVAEKVADCRDPGDNKFLELALSGRSCACCHRRPRPHRTPSISWHCRGFAEHIPYTA